MLNDYDSTYQLLNKKITKLLINEEKDLISFHIEGADPLVFEIYGDCCSRSWIEHITGIDNLIGHTIIDGEEIDLGEITGADKNEDTDYLQKYSLKLITDKGYFELEYRNDSNGYYGGSILSEQEWRAFDKDSLKIELKEDF